MRSMTRTDTPTTWDERGTLVAMLDYVRATARYKCEGVSEADARSAPLPGSPLMTMSGLINHLLWVERSWIQGTYLGEEINRPWSKEDPDAEMRIAVQTPIAELLDAYDAQSSRYQELVAARDLDSRSVGKNRHGDTFTLRWILMHLVEETARHNGHLDILRELADGTRGD